jgi:hypothetical protein
MTSKNNIFFWKNILKVAQVKGKKSSKFSKTAVFLNFKFLFFFSFVTFPLFKKNLLPILKFLLKFFHLWIFLHTKIFISYLFEYTKQGCAYNKLNFSFFAYKDIFWQIEFYLIPNYFWFNFTFLLKKTFFVSYSLILLEKISAKISKLFLSTKDNFFYFLQNSFFF